MKNETPMHTTPTFPADGFIETYDPADALGWIRLDDGRRVRFGQSACCFDPMGARRVRVVDAKPGPLGHLKAVRVEPLGERTLTVSERTALIRRVVLLPVDSYSDWALACRLPRDLPKEAATSAAIRAELEARGVSRAAVDEMVSLARWAEEVLSPRNGMVQHVIGDEGDVSLAIETAAGLGLISASEAERMRGRLEALQPGAT